MLLALEAARLVGLDSETTHINPREGKIRLLQLATGAETFVLDVAGMSTSAVQSLGSALGSDDSVKIIHNAKFDAKMLLHHFDIRLGRLFDTFLASKLVAAGNPDERHGLADLAARYLQRPLDKRYQAGDWSGQLSEAQIDYAATDAEILLPLREQLIGQIKTLNLIDVAKLEFDCAVPTAEMELAGIHFDALQWKRHIGGLESVKNRIESDLVNQLGLALENVDLFGHPEINLNSPPQVLEAFHRIGIDVRTTRESELIEFARQSPVVAQFLEYRATQKLLGTYGQALLERIDPSTNRIYADFHQIGTPTGRFSCSEPSVQQIPNLPEIRRCFCAPQGRKLAIADYSQIELRILAEFSQDPHMLEAFLSGVDLHRSTASQMFRVPVEEVTREQRGAAKQINFGLMYGMGAGGLAARIEVPLAEAERLIATYFQVYQKVAEWLRSSADTAVHTGHTRTKLGRLWRFHVDTRNREQVGMVQRLGKNAPIQGTSADILKRAMRLVRDGLKGLDAQMVNCVHDEIVLEAAESDAEAAAERLRREMINAGQEILKTVPIEVEVKVGMDWSK